MSAYKQICDRPGCLEWTKTFANMTRPDGTIDTKFFCEVHMEILKKAAEVGGIPVIDSRKDPS